MVGILQAVVGGFWSVNRGNASEFLSGNTVHP
jgi:hypothetical protein